MSLPQIWTPFIPVFDQGEQSQAQPMEASAVEADVGEQTCTDMERQSAAPGQEVGV